MHCAKSNKSSRHDILAGSDTALCPQSTETYLEIPNEKRKRKKLLQRDVQT
jgi:hypothetical protein